MSRGPHVPPFAPRAPGPIDEWENPSTQAARLARIIEAAWRGVGHPEVQAYVEPPIGAIRSNLIGGLPPRLAQQVRHA